MQEENMYRKTEETITDYFREEASSLLMPEQIEETLAGERMRLTRAEAAGIPCRDWMGANLQRYSKELLRRRQPFFAGYVFLGFCTEVSCSLLFFYVIQWAAMRLLSFSLSNILPAVPILLAGFFLWKYLSQFHTAKILANPQIPLEKIAGRRSQYRLVCGITVLALAAFSLSIFWNSITAALSPVDISHVFFLYVALILLSGIHNVLYDSQCISFISIGFFSLTDALPHITRFTADKEHAVEHYTAHRKTLFLASRKKTDNDLSGDSQLQQEYVRSLRSHLVTYRVYCLLALFILIVLDVLCLFQCTKAFTLSVLVLGLVSIFMTTLFFIAFHSCQTVLRHIRSGK